MISSGICIRFGAWPQFKARIGLLLAGACLTGVALWTPWRPGFVVGASMTPTLTPGSFFVYDRDYYRKHPIRPGDIVVARLDGKTLIKRVFAVGGDRFWARRELVGENLIHSPIEQGNLNRSRRTVDYHRRLGRSDAWLVHMRVPPGHMFLMGDGLHSIDSRDYGYVDAASILGRVTEPNG